MGANGGLGGEIEDLIIQALSHRERRNILRIIEAADGGVVYSDILGETGLSTGRLNYHLKELEAFIERGEERRYRLTPLGRRALSVLRHATEGVNENEESYASAATANRRKFVEKQLNRGFYIGASIFLTGSILATYILLVVETDPITQWILPLVYLFSAAAIYGMDRARKKSPRLILGFVDWLDWRLFGGRRIENGPKKFRGSKIGVCLILGALLGAVIHKVGAGLLLGLFIGAAMEI
ncbi:MAG: winged helix-turn-helix transcriptional regulator [Candidatus Bathyarchaeota archaeon]|nr:MAG: winged helix-turn-helix transcriptional regulator [Candidatus Bathyarchaeota archaeon]